MSERTAEERVRHWWPGFFRGVAEGVALGFILGASTATWFLIVAAGLR